MTTTPARTAVAAFHVVGLTVRTCNRDEMDPATGRMHQLRVHMASMTATPAARAACRSTRTPSRPGSPNRACRCRRQARAMSTSAAPSARPTAATDRPRRGPG